ncbi:hypothetical protein HanIR_Chr05g0210221 [Helianthus annuus]|nr:hypothetical protein HanIR_Chr05g0210221 [Helianthus annuus]
MTNSRTFLIMIRSLTFLCLFEWRVNLLKKKGSFKQMEEVLCKTLLGKTSLTKVNFLNLIYFHLMSV